MGGLDGSAALPFGVTAQNPRHSCGISFWSGAALDHLWNGNNLPDQELLVPDTFGCAGRGDSELGMGSWELEIGSLGPYLLHTKHLPERQIYYPKKCYSSL